jgi:hypothetical protein
MPAPHDIFRDPLQLLEEELRLGYPLDKAFASYIQRLKRATSTQQSEQELVRVHTEYLQELVRLLTTQAATAVEVGQTEAAMAVGVSKTELDLAARYDGGYGAALQATAADFSYRCCGEYCRR